MNWKFFMPIISMNLSRRRKISYALSENLRRHIRTPLLERERTLLSEFDTNIHEVSRKHRDEVDKIPGL